MTCMSLVKGVLDRIYRYDGVDDASICKSLDNLQRAYGDLVDNPIGVDYSHPATRFAYIYRYSTMHADLVCQMIERYSVLEGLFEASELLVTCCGGGPGSELLGVTKYMETYRKNTRVSFYLFDREGTWSECWAGVCRQINASFWLNPMFVQIDVTDRKSWCQLQDYLQADLFTLVYFLSELHGVKDYAKPFFSNMFLKAKRGSLFLYVDNNSSPFYDWFDEMARDSNLEILVSDHDHIVLGQGEDKTKLAPYYPRFEYPKLTADVAFRVCQKP